MRVERLPIVEIERQRLTGNANRGKMSEWSLMGEAKGALVEARRFLYQLRRIGASNPSSAALALIVGSCLAGCRRMAKGDSLGPAVGGSCGWLLTGENSMTDIDDLKSTFVQVVSPICRREASGYLGR